MVAKSSVEPDKDDNSNRIKKIHFDAILNSVYQMLALVDPTLLSIVIIFRLTISPVSRRAVDLHLRIFFDALYRDFREG